MDVDELFEADYVSNFGEAVANQTIIIRRVDFSSVYCEVTAAFISELTSNAKGDTSDDRKVMSDVFAHFGSALSNALFGEVNNE